MRKIAILNQKGGVGKTTTAVNLSAALAATGQRVCLVDLDPQGHASLHSTLDEEAPPDQVSMYQVMVGDTPLAAVRRQVSDNLWLAGATIDLAAVEIELADVQGREVVLRNKLRDEQEVFDYLLLDCPPSLGVLTLNALTAADEVLIPLQPHFLALHGLSKLLETIGLVSQRLNPWLKLRGVVLCMYESGTRLAAEISRDVEAFLAETRGGTTPWSEAQLFETRIRRNIRLAEAPSFGQSIFEYAPDSHGAEDYLQLCYELLAVHQAAAAPAA